jgi:RNA polymerase sigma factor (TIGR02999 family)
MPNASKNALRTAGELTLLLSDVNNPEALWTVMRLAYNELHSIAGAHFRREFPGRTLQPTALLHEACLRLIEGGAVLQNRRHFFGAASKAMRRILVDSARRRRATKRGGQWRRVEFSEAERIGFEQQDDLLDFHAALTRLAAAKPLWSEVAELRVFGGWSTAEAAVILEIATSTARRRWALARRWLREDLTAGAHRAEADLEQS